MTFPRALETKSDLALESASRKKKKERKKVPVESSD